MEIREIITTTTVLILALVTTATTTAAAISCDCGDICVNTTGWWRDGGAFNANGAPIQAGVDNATAGETICVKAGSYTENVGIETSHLTLAGEGAGVVAVTAALNSDHVFMVTASYVNVSGFSVTATGWSATSGIYLNDVDHCNISGNTASNNHDGIYLDSSSNNTLLNNIASGNGHGGIYLRDCSNNNILLNNTANSNRRYSIHMESSSNNTLLNNTARGNDYGIYMRSSSNNTLIGNIALYTVYGIQLISSSNNLLANNTASNSDNGICLKSSCKYNLLANNIASNNDYYGIGLFSSSNNALTGNTASGNGGGTGIGIWLTPSCKYNTLTGNTVSNNYWFGIWLWSSENNTLASNIASGNSRGIVMESSSNNALTNNTVSGNSRGIHLYNADGNTIVCNWVHNNTYIGFHLVSGSTDNNISYNNIIANGGYNATSGGYEYQFKNYQFDVVNATNNWWGTTDNDIINASIFDWQDDPNNGIVTYLPKLGSPSPCAPIPELPTATLFVVGLLALVGYVRIRRKT